MVRVFAVKHLDVKRYSGILRERLEELTEKFGIHRADLLGGECHTPNEVRAPRDIERGARQRLVHRQIGMGIARNAAHVAKRFRHGKAQRNAAILNRVMLVDMQVALGGQRDIDARMARELLQHMIEKADTCGDGKSAGAV